VTSHEDAAVRLDAVRLDAVRRLDAFARCTDAEEYFAVLDVEYDPSVLEVNRLHILKYFAIEIEKPVGGDPEEGDPGHRLAGYQRALRRAYQEFLTASALDHRLFAGLERRAPQAFVGIDEITVERVAEATPERYEVTP
jgi:nitrogenase-stabilizing/protective protein